MALYISSLNSGSNGNAYYVGNDRDAVLIDAGLSCRETERRMKRSGLELSRLRGIFISHEHSDHIRGVEVLSRRHRLPVHITTATQAGGRLSIEEPLRRPFAAYEPVAAGSLIVTPFPKQHDASEPHSFLVTDGSVTVGVFTDIGTGCEHVVRNFSRCDAAFLECNYDDHLLETGPYPLHLKRRIRSDRGHLSNSQALELFRNHGSRMRCLLLAHLSQENNDPLIVESVFAPHAGRTKVAVASRYRESEVYRIEPGTDDVRVDALAQLSLFGS